MMTQDNKRRRLTRPYPQFPLKEIERIPKIIHSARNGNEMHSKELANAMAKTIKSSEYIMMIKAAKLYGLVTGTYNTNITMLPLAQKIISPKNQQERENGLREAALNPRTFRMLIDLLDENKLPEDSYVKNILERELGVHHDLTDECLGIFKENTSYADIFGIREEEIEKKAEENFMPEKKNEQNQIMLYIKNEARKQSEIEKMFNLLGIKYLAIEQSETNSKQLSKEIKRKMKLCNSAVIEKNEDAITFQIIGAATVLYDEKIVLLTGNNLEELNFIQNLSSKNIIQISQN